MNSKKMGLFAAAALLATQANAAEAKKDAKAPKAVKAEGEMICVGSCAPACAGKPIDTAKDEPACGGAKGKWMTQKEFADSKKAKEHKH